MFQRKSRFDQSGSDITKEEALATIQEGAFCCLDHQSSTSIKGLKLDCEKISVKGAAYGQIEIIDSKYISFSPSREQRPDHNSLPPWSLVTMKMRGLITL